MWNVLAGDGSVCQMLSTVGRRRQIAAGPDVDFG